MRRRVTTDDALLLLAALIWAAHYSVTKSVLRELPPLLFNALRFGGAAVVLSFLLWLREGFAPIGARWKSVVLLGLVGNTAYQLFFIVGLDRSTASQASLFAATTPVFTLILGRIAGHEVVTSSAALGVVVTVVGVMLLLGESAAGALSDQAFWVGDVFILAASFCWAWYTVWSRTLLREMTPMALTTLALIAGAVPLVLLGGPSLVTVDLAAVSGKAWIGLVYACLFSIVVAFLIWLRAVQRLGPTRTAVYLNLVPVLAVLIARWSLGEQLTQIQLVGGAAVVAGIWITRSSRPVRP